MRLYYTASSEPEAAQSDPRLSLGGYKSATALTNSKFGNLFSSITPVTVVQFNQNQYVGLVLKNETGIAVTGIQLWFEYPTGCYSKFRVAAVDMVEDTDGNLRMEHLPDINSKPICGEFYEADGEVNKVDLGDLINEEQIGIWIERELLLSVISAQSEAVYEVDPDLQGRFKEVVLPTDEEIKIGISYT